MADLVIAAASVLYVSGPVDHGQVAGEAFNAGASVYLKSDGKWYKAQSDGTAEEAGSGAWGMALATAAAVGAKLSVARPGAVVTVGTGAAGTTYILSRAAGSICPTADAASTDKVTVVAVGAGSSQLQLGYIYNAGQVVP
jgi:hypothetical protein